LNIEQRLRRADFDDINAVRSVLEKEIVKLAAQNGSEEQFIDIGIWLEKRKAAIQAENKQDCEDADIEFHLSIANASGNPVLADLYYNFTVIMRNFFSARDRQGISYFALNHYLHEQLFSAIRSKQAEHAQIILQSILDNNY
jgi:DNA-binding FadR family transcriptional regulator